MGNITDYIVDFTEELGKEGYSIIKAGVKTLYKAKGELAVYTIQSYMNTRFEIRLEDFAYEQDNLSDEAKKNFYKNIDHEKLNFLFELLEKARTLAYDLHAKILSKLYGNLIKNSKLNYHEKTLLSNIDILNDEDLIHFHRILKESVYDINEAEIKKIKILFPIKSYTEYYIFEKLERVGLFVEYKTNGGFQFASENKKVLENKSFYIHNFTVDIYNVLDLILENNHSS